MSAFCHRIQILSSVMLWMAFALSGCNSFNTLTGSGTNVVPPAGNRAGSPPVSSTAPTPSPSLRQTIDSMVATMVAQKTTEALALQKSPSPTVTVVLQSVLSFGINGWLAIDNGQLKLWNASVKIYENAPVEADSVQNVVPGDYQIGAPDERYATSYQVAYKDNVPVYVVDTSTGNAARVVNGAAELADASNGLTGKTVLWTTITEHDQTKHQEMFVILHFNSLDDLKQVALPTQAQINQILNNPDNVYAKTNTGVKIPLGFGAWKKSPDATNAERSVEFLPLGYSVPLTVNVTQTVPENFQQFREQYPDMKDSQKTVVFIPAVVGNRFEWMLIGYEGQDHALTYLNHTTEKRDLITGYFTAYKLSAQILANAHFFEPGRQVDTRELQAFGPAVITDYINTTKAQLRDGTLTQQQYDAIMKYYIPGMILWNSVIAKINSEPSMVYSNGGYELINALIDVTVLH